MPMYRLNEGGYAYDTVEAENIGQALNIARNNVDASNYPSNEDGDGTMWIHVEVQEVDGERKESATVRVDPPEPRCLTRDHAHDWQSPHAIVGGIAENPGVQGHGGGVIIRECCMRCGCARITDTWAQDPSDGRVMGDAVSYEPGRYADDVREMRESEDAS